MSLPNSSFSRKAVGDVDSDQFPARFRVLVVDSDPTCLVILEKLLRYCLYQVTKTDRAETALALLRENRHGYDIVLSNIDMPDMDGFKLLELLEMDLPVIMMSNSKSVVMKGVTHGVCAYLTKPIRVEELKTICQQVVRKKYEYLHCKRIGISTWPSRKRKIVHSPRTVQMGSIKELQVSTPAVQNENLMTVIDRSSEIFFTDSSLGIDTNNTRRPYPLPHSIGETSTKETDDPITAEETSFRDTRTLFSASTVQSELCVTIKAKCGGDFFIFQLFSSSGIHDLSQQVSQRLNLEVGTYVVKYLDDDDDLILIVCDDDLHQYISSSISKGRFTLKIMIEPIKAS